MIRVLTFTNLYPNSERPQHGLFIEHRLRHVVATGEVQARVVAPVPWFPSTAKVFGDYATHAAVPRRETRHGIEIWHPRHLVIPKLGMRLAPRLLAKATLPLLRRMIAKGFDFDVIDAHYLYPDGVAAVQLGDALDKPVVLTARGSDVNLIPQISPTARAAIVDATRRCAAIVAVSDGLRVALIELGAEPKRIKVIRNGVDRKLFRPSSAARNANGTQHLLSVGSLVPNKGHHLVIEALRELPEANLVIAGRGPMREQLETTAARHGVAARVQFAGSVAQAELRNLYASADVLVLASEMEGLPNVVLEALACGTPVVATRVGGVPEVITSADGGRLIDERSSGAIAAAIRELLAAPPSRDTVRAVTDPFDWSRCANSVVKLFERVSH